MKLVADESIDGPIVHLLRSAGHQVEYIAESHPGIIDDAVLQISLESDALLITADKDFGDLVFRRQLAHAGILLCRFAGLEQPEKAAVVECAIAEHGMKLKGRFSVLTPESLRIRI